MRTHHIFLTFLLSAATLIWPQQAQAKLKVVASVPTLAAIAQELGKRHVDVKSLSLSSQDPHFVDPKPSFALKLNQADLLLTVGLGLEVGWLKVLQEGARNAKIQRGTLGFLDCSTLVSLLDKRQSADRSEGDIHIGGNPHYLFDPRRIARVASGIAVRLSELDPENSTAYKNNLKSFHRGLNALQRQVEKHMAPHRGAPIVSYHKSWIYLADWLDLREVAFIEPKPGIPPHARHVAGVLRTIREKNVRLILQESFYPSRTGQLIAKKGGATLLKLQGGVNFREGQSVRSFLTSMVNRLQQSLTE